VQVWKLAKLSGASDNDNNDTCQSYLWQVTRLTMARGKVICGSDMNCGGQTPMHYSTPQKARSSGGQEEIRRRMKKHWYISPKRNVLM